MFGKRIIFNEIRLESSIFSTSFEKFKDFFFIFEKLKKKITYLKFISMIILDKWKELIFFSFLFLFFVFFLRFFVFFFFCI